MPERHGTAVCPPSPLPPLPQVTLLVMCALAFLVCVVFLVVYKVYQYEQPCPDSFAYTVKKKKIRKKRSQQVAVVTLTTHHPPPPFFSVSPWKAARPLHARGDGRRVPAAGPRGPRPPLHPHQPLQHRQADHHALGLAVDDHHVGGEGDRAGDGDRAETGLKKKHRKASSAPGEREKNQ